MRNYWAFVPHQGASIQDLEHETRCLRSDPRPTSKLSDPIQNNPSPRGLVRSQSGAVDLVGHGLGCRLFAHRRRRHHTAAEEAAPVAGLAVPGSDRLRLCRLYPGLLGGDADLSDPRYLEAWPKARRCTISRPPPMSRRRARWLAPWARALPTASMLSASDAASNALVRAGLIE